MKSFEEFEDRVDDLLTQVAGPAAGMEMLVRAKGGGAGPCSSAVAAWA